MALRFWSVLFLAAGCACAQTAFEVASVKASGPMQRGRAFGMRGGPGSSDPGQLTWNYASLQEVLQEAYNLKEYQISGPAWLSSERYDIAAKVPAGADKEHLRLMLQNLLADRFQVKLHRETKEIAVFELTVGKNGPRFKESGAQPDAGGPAPEDPQRDGVKMLKTGRDGVVELPPSMQGKGHIALRSFKGAELRVRGEGLGYLIERIENDVHRPVIDKTGLTGVYDYALAWLPESMAANSAANSAVDDRRADLFSAVQSQLGLKLEPKKMPGEVLIVDSANKSPTEN